MFGILLFLVKTKTGQVSPLPGMFLFFQRIDLLLSQNAKHRETGGAARHGQQIQNFRSAELLL